MMRRFTLLLALLAYLGVYAQMQVSDLRVEGMESPLGIDNAEPHFSWKVLSAKPQPQLSYEIEVASSPELLQQDRADLWVSGRVASTNSVMIPYGGRPLASRQLCYWRVRSHGRDITTAWSPIQRFSVGVIAPDALHGQYVGLGAGQEHAVLLQRSFRMKRVGQTALLHVNSLGYHQVYLNGQRVSDAALAPAVSQMNKRSLIVTYDVTSLLHKGDNHLVLWIGSGWYKKDTFRAAYDGPAVRADLDVQQGSAWQTVVSTDATWQAALSGYQDTGNWRPHGFGGERIDARLAPQDMSAASLARLEWQAAQTPSIDTLKATPQMCQSTIVRETVQPIRLEKLGQDRWLVDMGKVLNGQFEIRLPQLPEGHEVRVVYGDNINDNSDMNDLGGEDLLIASGRPEGDVFRNRFNHHCFRYVTLYNLPFQPDVRQIRAHRIGMDVATTGTFVSSDDDLNAIHQMISYTMGNLMFSGYMVDCAHIERLGYGGDGNASTLSLQNCYDVAPVFMNWLQAWNDAIQPDGGLPHTAPNPYVAGGGPYWCTFIVQAPWRTWRNFGDDRLLHRCYDNMKLWLRYVDKYTEDGIMKKYPDTEYRYWYLGDWLAPQGVDVTNEESMFLVNNCALVQVYSELMQIAEYMGRSADVQDFSARRTALARRINEVYFHPESGTYGTGSQLDMVYPLLVGVVPPEHIETVTRHLKQLSDHIQVGLVGVPVLTEWATLHHQPDFIYRMLKQEDCPGYLYMLRNGATGTWEAWDKGRARSHFHNCYNGIDSWFFQALGGIIPTAPGYREVLIDPQAPKGLDWIRATRETPYGTIVVHWKQYGDGTLEVHAEIPNGITATVGGNVVTAGTYNYKVAPQR